MSLKEKLIAAGADKLVEILLAFYEKNKDWKREMDMIIAGFDDNPKKISAAIRKEINAFKRSKSFVSLKESREVSKRLENVRKSIANDMLSKSPKSAFELMLEFLDLHAQTMERCDDSGGLVGEVFTTACKDLGKISEKASLPLSQLVDIVFSKHMKDEYNIYNGIICHFENSLKKKGLLMLKSKFEEYLTNCGGRWGEGDSISGLTCIADILKDVDAYISACSITPAGLHRYIPDIARRLIEHGRGQEALDWLDRNKTDTSSEYCKLRVEALKSIEENNKAQDMRLIWFNENLSVEAYREILKSASADFAASFKAEAMEKVLSWPKPYVSLSFLKEIEDLEGLGKYIRYRHESLAGLDYILLRPIAEFLENSDPLAATFVYRTMIEEVLDKVKHGQYKHAAKHIVKCRMLGQKISDWEALENHDEYFEDLKKTHKLKRTFWSCYEDAASRPTPAAKRRKV